MYMRQDGLSKYLVVCVCVIQARSSVVKPPGPNTPAAAILNKQPKYVLVQRTCMAHNIILYLYGVYEILFSVRQRNHDTGLTLRCTALVPSPNNSLYFF